MSTRTMTINMGPQHPATHGVLRVVLEVDGEKVVKATPVVGYLHTGIEKTMESLLYYKAIPCTDRMDYLAPMSNNLGYCLAVEKLMDIEIPKKVQFARVCLAEFRSRHQQTGPEVGVYVDRTSLREHVRLARATVCTSTRKLPLWTTLWLHM